MASSTKIQSPPYVSMPTVDMSSLSFDSSTYDPSELNFNEEMFTVRNLAVEPSKKTEEYDAFSYCKVVFIKSREKIAIPFRNIKRMELIESQNSIMYYGIIEIIDPRSNVVRKHSLTGQEIVFVEFGIGQKLKTSFIGKITKIAGQSKLGKSNTSTMEIHFSHPMIDVFNKIFPMAYDDSIHNIIEDVMTKFNPNTREKAIITPTRNKGLYVSPALTAGNFLKYLRDISISTSDKGAYSLFTTRYRHYFVPKDYFNSLLPKIQLSDIYSVDKNIDTALHLSFQPFSIVGEAKGIHRRKGWGWNFNDARLINFEYDLEDEKSKKQFLGKYIPLPAKPIEAQSYSEYTGFRTEADIKGHITNSSEGYLEGISKAIAVIYGDVNIEPGQKIEIHVDDEDPDELRIEPISGPWIINTVKHDVNPKSGYLCFLDLYRNSITEISDKGLLMQVG